MAVSGRSAPVAMLAGELVAAQCCCSPGSSGWKHCDCEVFPHAAAVELLSSCHCLPLALDCLLDWLAAVSSAGDALGCDRAGDRCPQWAVLATDRAGDPFLPGETSAD